MIKEIRPTCINHGCDKIVATNGVRWRPVCGRCHRAGYGKETFKEGVTPFRTGKCANQSGYLGFTCPIDYDKSDWVIGHTIIDHIDGNHLNNSLDNVQELCDICHKEKSKRNGDFKEQHKYNYKKVSAI